MNAFSSAPDHDTLPRDKQLACDLRCTLIHECGHLIIGDHVGVQLSYADFWLYEDADQRTERLVGGRAHYHPHLDGREKQLMGVAGIVAESLAVDDEDADGFFSSTDLLEQIEGSVDYMSDTDREAAGEIDETLLDECADILRQRWTDLIAKAVYYLGQFETLYDEDDDAVQAASSVRVKFEEIASRFPSSPERLSDLGRPRDGDSDLASSQMFAGGLNATRLSQS